MEAYPTETPTEFPKDKPTNQPDYPPARAHSTRSTPATAQREAVPKLPFIQVKSVNCECPPKSDTSRSVERYSEGESRARDGSLTQGSARNARGTAHGECTIPAVETGAHGDHATSAPVRHPEEAKPTLRSKGQPSQKLGKRRRAATRETRRERRKPARENTSWSKQLTALLPYLWQAAMLLVLWLIVRQLPGATANPVHGWTPVEPQAKGSSGIRSLQSEAKDSLLAHLKVLNQYASMFEPGRTGEAPANQGRSPLPQQPVIQAYDCSKPSFLGRYNRQTFCHLTNPAARVEAKEEVKRRVAVAQEVWESKRNGYRCHGTKRVSAHLCGLWSYEKAVPALESVEVLEISAENCARMALHGLYGVDHRMLSGIRAPGRTEITYSMTGLETLEDGNAWCQGETIVHNGERIDRVVRTAKLELVVANETFLVDERTQEVFAEGAREELACQANSPAQAIPNMFGCTGAMATYAWHKATQPWCSLHFVNELEGVTSWGEKGEVIFTSASAMARFHILTTGKPAGECHGNWVRTSINQIWASRDADAAQKLPKVEGIEVNPLLALTMLKTYVQHQLASHPTPDLAGHQAACRASLAAAPAELNFRMTEGRFGRVSGDAVIVFTCPEATVQLRKAETCHRDVPVQHEKLPFADTLTRILRADSPRVPCAANFAPLIEGVRGWWQASPALNPVQPPAAWLPYDPKGSQPEETPRGFYTEDEKEAWTRMQMLPVYKQQIVSMIEVGSCGSTAGCPIQTLGGEGSFDWSTLERAVPGYAAYETAKEIGHYALMLGSIMGLLLALPTAWLIYKQRQNGTDRIVPNQSAVNVAVKYEASAPKGDYPKAPATARLQYPGLSHLGYD